jgi:hypothetical protein
MAQYTQILAQEYNDIQYNVTKVLGDKGYAIEPAFGYGVTTSSVSVVAGQEISTVEWDKLAQDIRSAYWYQSSTDYGVPAAVVQGADIYWSNVVAYQNAGNTIVSNATTNQTGAGQRHQYSSSLTLNGTSWPAVVVDTPKKFISTSTVGFTDSTQMRNFFNAGGLLQVYWTVSGNPTAATKNYAYKNVLTASGIGFSRTEWIAFGGLSQQTVIGPQSQTFTVTSGDTIDGPQPDAYTGTLPHKITRSCTVLMDCANSFVRFTTEVTDGATRTTYEGAVPAPKITLNTSEVFDIYRPEGSQPVAGGNPIPGTRPVVIPGSIGLIQGNWQGPI